MMVFSPLSLYTTHLGWQIYDIIFEGFHQMGLWALGLLFIAFRFVKSTLLSSGEGHYSANHALNVFMLELFIFFSICVLFVYPSIHLSVTENTFKPVCMAPGSTIADSKVGETGTNYDDDFSGMLSEEIKVPIAFSVLENIASALTYALMGKVACTDGLNNIKSDMISTHIPSQLKHEIYAFKNQCYLDAKMKFNSNPPDTSRYSAIMAQYGGRDDLNWVGSHVLRSLYYSEIKAKSPVKRYKYADYPSENFSHSDIDSALHPDHGYPGCDVWWEDIRNSLKELIDDKDFVNSHVQNRAIYLRIIRLLNEHNVAGQQDADHDELAHDLIARTLIENTSDVIDRAGAFDTTNGSFTEGATTGLLRFGQAIKSWTATPLKRQAIKQTLPVMLAIFMFFVTVLMPVLIMLSGCSPKAVGAFVGLKFILIFMNFIFFLVTWINGFLVQSVSGNGELTSVIQNTLVLFYFIAAILIVNLAGVCGWLGAGSLTNLVHQASSNADETASTGTSYLKKGVFRAVKKGIQ